MKKMKPTVEKFHRLDGTVVYFDKRTGYARKRWWRTKARIPGTVRPSRLPGGSSFRNNWQEPLPS